MFILLQRIERDEYFYVGNLSYKMNDKDLEGIFAKFGAVKSAKVIMDRETGKIKRFWFY